MTEPHRAPLLSVVVACFRQADPLDLVLESFLRQDFPHEDYEIIVVDDHSPDREACAVVAAARSRHPTAAIHYLRQHRSDGGCYGASAVAKNVGLRLASGKYVYFNNAEIVQAGQSLAYIVERLEFSAATLCLRGRVMDTPRALLEGKDQAELEVLHDATDASHERVASADHAGLAAVPRHLLLAVGGNDERFDHWGKEDLDLARRLKTAGAVYVYDAQLKSFHVQHQPNFQRRGDYQRMAALLQASARDDLVEANVGRLWGQLDPVPANELEASVLVDVGTDLTTLAARLEALCYGHGAEKIEVAVTVREPLRAATEALLARRFKGTPLLVLPAIPEAGSLGRIVNRLRAARVVFSQADCEPWCWGHRVAGAATAQALVAPGPDVVHTARSGSRQPVPWEVERQAALASMAELSGFEDLAPVLLNSPVLARWGDASVDRTPRISASTATSSSVLALVPYFRCDPWVNRALVSLACQTRTLDGIALLLDAGEPVPREVLRDFPQVSVYAADQHVGPYALVQSMIDGTDHDWYLFQDADDWSAVDRLERLLATATDHNAEMVGSQEIRVFDADGSAMPVTFPLDVNVALRHAPGHALLHPSSIVRRSLLTRLGGFATGLRFSADTEFVLRATYVGRIVNAPEALYFRRSRADSLTTAADTGLDSSARQALLQEMKSRARSNAARVAEGKKPNLQPCEVRPRVNLRHVSGPALGS
jgi:GT2 family glycosyltransferase